jgi:hypothetical protein
VSQHGRASTVLAGGQTKRAFTLLEDTVVKVHEITLDESHPDRLASRHELASASLTNEPNEACYQALRACRQSL